LAQSTGLWPCSHLAQPTGSSQRDTIVSDNDSTVQGVTVLSDEGKEETDNVKLKVCLFEWSSGAIHKSNSNVWSSVVV